MPVGCYILVFFRALAEALEGDFLKMFRVCICMEWPGAAKTSTQASSRRHWAARKGKDEMLPSLHRSGKSHGSSTAQCNMTV